MTRRQMRENCFVLLFESCFSDYAPEELFELAEDCEEISVNETVRQYYLGIQENLETIDEEISKNLKNWTISRISKVSLSILRLAVYELKILNEIDHAIIINEAIEIIKKYSTKDDASFVNGVLGSVVKGME